MKDSVKEYFKKSGHNFHYRVVKKLRRNDWNVVISPYYSDFATDKAREIDIYAQKFDGVQSFGNKDNLYVKSKIFGECKWVTENSHHVVWLDDHKQEKATVNFISRNTSFDSDYIKHSFGKPLKEAPHHHLVDQPVIKLFDAKGESDLYKAIDQLLSGFVYLRNAKEIVNDRRDSQRKLKNDIPIIFVNSFDNFYKMIDDELEKIPHKESFLTLETNHAYSDTSGNKKSEYFLIDIVNFAKIDDYIELLNKDRDEMMRTTRL